MFAINAPLRSHEDVERLVLAGADSFYCGLNDAAGTNGGGGLNQRQSDRSSFSGIADLQRAVTLAHELGREVFIAINTRLLTDTYVDRFTRQLDIAADLGLDAVIVGSMNGLMIARERHPEMKLAGSVGLGVLNSRSARFWADLGVYRVIVSRHLTPREIAMVCDGAPDVEVEAFLMNGKCGNFDSMCGYDYYDPAGAMANFTGCVFVADRNVTRYRRYACGACALSDFGTRPNFAAAKIIGRDFDVESVTKATELTFKVRAALFSGMSAPEFREFSMAAYRDIYGRPCERNCHYPDEGFPGGGDAFTASAGDEGCSSCEGCDGCGGGTW
ncbi:MAG TPA: U32 family peptidase [Myxococcota bacterium]|nr:U32 family peptidase [Myxococcota bacterium]